MTLNEYLMSFRDGVGMCPPNEKGYKSSFPIAARITCKDGFSLSVQANKATYCSPRENLGPWYEVEVGFPSAKPEFIMEYAETPDEPTQTVYGYVPIELVEQLIAHHGGMEESKFAIP